MANLDSTRLLSEPEYGCEHLASILTQDVQTAGQFKKDFRKQHELLAPFSKTEVVAVQTTGLRTVASLKPKYYCLSCSEACLNTERKAHTKRTGHVFYMESRNRFVFCQSCVDFVYDLGLERLRSPSGKYEHENGKKKWAEDHAAEAYVKNNTNKNPCRRHGARGLWNMGQTCYQAVVLQALLHDPIMNAYFLAGGHDIHSCQQEYCMACAAAQIFMDFNSGDNTDAVSAATLLYHGWQVNRDMAGYSQQDAHEYFQFLVNGLHACTPGHTDDYGSKCDCFFHQTFYGELRSSVICYKCGQTTNTDEPMADLSLDVQRQTKRRNMGRPNPATNAPTLTGCLESFTAVEDLHTEAAYHCEKCGNTPQRASKRLQIRKLPVILCMQLKRYEHTAATAASEKMNCHIDFPMTLNMLPYTVKKDKERVDTSKYVYDLSTVVVHQGTMDSGHYYAYTRLAGDKWVLMDDNKVSVASVSDVLRQDAYLLFYSIRSVASAGIL